MHYTIAAIYTIQQLILYACIEPFGRTCVRIQNDHTPLLVSILVVNAQHLRRTYVKFSLSLTFCLFEFKYMWWYFLWGGSAPPTPRFFFLFWGAPPPNPRRGSAPDPDQG